jgi:hypothetical protein
MGRKTIEVGKVLRMANAFLANKNTGAAERESIAWFLESVLCETNNYMGFRYLDPHDYPNEVEGLGSRRYYYPSNAVRDDFEAEHKN